MNVFIWIVIIIIAILLFWILRKWIKRLIFIAILLCLAFFIYWLFSPSGASRLRYNVRTFPDRIQSWFSNKSFLDYDSYKLKLPLVWSDWDENADESENLKIEKSESVGKDEISQQEDANELEKNVEKSDSEEKSIKSFSSISSIKFVNLDKKLDSISHSGNNLSWYSKSELLWIIGNYIEKNLKDDNEIVVTVEYVDESDLDKIILKTQPKSQNESHLISDDMYIEKKDAWLYDYRLVSDEKEQISEPVKLQNEDQKSEKTINNQSKNKTSSKLSQKDLKDAEEVISVLF